jgi:hypothetical protein
VSSSRFLAWRFLALRFLMLRFLALTTVYTFFNPYFTAGFVDFAFGLTPAADVAFFGFSQANLFALRVKL